MNLLLVFFAVTYAVTWICFFTAAALARETSSLAMLRQPIFLFGVFAPSFVAMALTAKVGGRDAIHVLLGRIFAWRVRPQWYVFALAYIAAIKIAAAIVYRLATGDWPHFGARSLYIIAAAMLVSTWVQAGEEIGWRGFALPRLADRFGLGPASIVLGVLWACWHLPLFFISGTDTTGQSFPIYLLQVTALSVTMAWLYWKTDQSLLLVMAFHAAVNNTADIVPSAVPAATNPFTLNSSPIARLTAGLLWIGAAYFLVRMRGAKLADGHSPATIAPSDLTASIVTREPQRS